MKYLILLAQSFLFPKSLGTLAAWVGLMFAGLMAIAIAAHGADAKKTDPPKVTDAQSARYYRNASIIARAQVQIAQAQQQMEAAAKDIRALVDELKAGGCEVIENEKGLACSDPKPAPEAATKD